MSDHNQGYAEKVIALARAMGWTEIRPLMGALQTITDYAGVPPEFEGHPDADTRLPKFYGPAFNPEAEQAKALLLRWLAQDDVRWRDFDYTFFKMHLEPEEQEQIRALGHGIWRKRVMLATPAQVADAAFKSLGLEGQDR